MNKLLLLLICLIYIISTDCSGVKTKLPRTEKTDIPGMVEENSPVAGYRVQIGIFDNQAEADKEARSARSKTDYPVYVEYKIPFYRVEVGDFVRKSDAEECVRVLKKEGFGDARYVFRSSH